MDEYTALTIQDSAALWGILNFYVLSRPQFEIRILHCKDMNLKKLLNSHLSIIEKNIKYLRKILEKNNIDYPASYPSRDQNREFDLNEATKYTDMEIAGLSLMTFRAALPIFSGIISSSFSKEIINLVKGYHDYFYEIILNTIELMSKKNWERRPPKLPVLSIAKK